MVADFSKADIDDILSKLDFDEKIELLTGAGRCALPGNERLGVPVAHVSHSLCSGLKPMLTKCLDI